VRGAIDLASIMVGVLVIAIIGGVISASVFVVIPWAQDSAARASLDAVKIAQSVSHVNDGKFSDWAGLLSQKLVTGTPMNVDSIVNADGTCYVNAALSGSGTAFYQTNRSNTILDDVAGPPDTSWCANSAHALADPVTNMVTDPSFELSVGGVTYNSTAVQSSAWKSSGSKSLLVSATNASNISVASLGPEGVYSFGMKPGRTYTALITARVESKQVGGLNDFARSLDFITKTPAGYTETISTAPNAPGVYVLRVTVAVAADATEIWFRAWNGGTQGAEIWYDDFMVVEVPDINHPYTGEYFDGSSANGTWNGAVNASTSTGWVRR
jgi:hypothetical protein